MLYATVMFVAIVIGATIAACRFISAAEALAALRRRQIDGFAVNHNGKVLPQPRDRQFRITTTITEEIR